MLAGSGPLSHVLTYDTSFHWLPTTCHRLSTEILFNPQVNPLRDDGKHNETYRTESLSQRYIPKRGEQGFKLWRFSLGGGGGRQ